MECSPGTSLSSPGHSLLTLITGIKIINRQEQFFRSLPSPEQSNFKHEEKKTYNIISVYHRIIYY